jgi:hypothetical protein
MNIPTAYANELLGGYHTVTSITERDHISPDRRTFGMLVYVSGTDQFFQLKLVSSPDVSDNLNWTLANFLGAGSFTEWVNSVISATGTPATSPNIGDRYLVTTGTGIWTGFDDLIVEWNGSSWSTTVPTNGMSVRLDSDSGPIYSYLDDYPHGSWEKQNFVITGTPTQVAYFDSDGNITSDGTFTRSPVGTLISSTSSFGPHVSSLSLGASSFGPTGSILSIFNSNTNEVGLIGAFYDASGYRSGIGYFSTQSNAFYNNQTGSYFTSFDYDFKLPISDGTPNQAILTDGSGNLFFGTPSVPIQPQQYPQYVIATSSIVTVPDYQEYFIYGDLDVNGTLDIGTYGKVVILNGGLSTGGSSTIINSGNIEIHTIPTVSDISGPAKYLPIYGSTGLTSSTAYYDNSGNFIIGTPSPFLSVSNSGGISFATVSNGTMSNYFLMWNSVSGDVSYTEIYVNQVKTFNIGPDVITQSSTDPNTAYTNGTIIKNTGSGSWSVSADSFHDSSNVVVNGVTGLFTVKPGIYNIYIQANYTSSSAFGSNAPLWIQTHLKGADPGHIDLYCVSRGFSFYSAETTCPSQGANRGVAITTTSTFYIKTFSPSAQTLQNSHANIAVSFEKVG